MSKSPKTPPPDEAAGAAASGEPRTLIIRTPEGAAIRVTVPPEFPHLSDNATFLTTLQRNSDEIPSQPEEDAPDSGEWQLAIMRWPRKATTPSPLAEVIRAAGERAGLTGDAIQRVIAALEQLGIQGTEQAPPTAPPHPRRTPVPPGSTSILSDPHTQASIRSMWEPKGWASPPDGFPRYDDAQTTVQIFMVPPGAEGAATPEAIAAASQRVLELDDDKVSAFLICMGKWLAEAADGDPHQHIADTRIHVDDILAFRGIQKHHKGGYRREQKEAALRDILLLRSIWVRSNEEVWETDARGRRHKVRVNVNSPLLNVEWETQPDSDGKDVPYAFRIRPGAWATHYLNDGTRWTALLLQPIMRYDPRQGVGRMGMRLGIYLTMQWRIRAHTANFTQPWQMSTLLEGARIPLPTHHPERFRREVEDALAKLQSDGMLGICEQLDVLSDTLPPKVWWPQWLKNRWRLLPPAELRQHYQSIERPSAPELPQPSRRSQKPRPSE